MPRRNPDPSSRAPAGLERTMDAADLGLLVLRLVVGLTFAAHGAQKAFGWFDGIGWVGWQGIMVRLGFRPFVLFAAISTGAELIGGLFLALGALTPLAAAILVGQLIVIIARSHWANGFWNKTNGFEFPLALLGGTVAIGLIGPGAISLDAFDGLAPSDTVRLALIVIGLIGGLLTLTVPSLSGKPTDEVATHS
jgi:putative oxidoreductase